MHTTQERSLDNREKSIREYENSFRSGREWGCESCSEKKIKKHNVYLTVPGTNFHMNETALSRNKYWIGLTERGSGQSGGWGSCDCLYEEEEEEGLWGRGSAYPFVLEE